MHLFKRFTVLLLVVSCAACSSPYTTVRKNAAFTIQDLETSQLVVLPSDIIVNTIDSLGAKERMSEYEEHLEDVVSQSIVDVLLKRGYDAKLLSKHELYNSNTSLAVLELKDRYNDELTSEALYKERTMLKEQAFNIQSNVGYHNLKLNANKRQLLIFSNYECNAKTSGAKITSFMLHALIGLHSSGDDASLIIGVAEYKDGNLLWLNKSNEMSSVYTNILPDGSSEEKENASFQEVVERNLEPLVE